MKPAFQIETLPNKDFFQSEHVIMPADDDVPLDSIGWHVDCSDNPLDLRPAVDTILHAIEEKLPSASSEHPLVVLLGELHSRPTTKLLLPMAASQLAAQDRRFSVAIEQDHNIWSILAAKNFGMKLPEHLRKEPGYLHDPDGHGVLSAFLACLTSRAAPLSQFDRIATLYKLSQNYKNNIRIFFNDAAFKKERFDLGDPLTARFVNRFYGQAPVRIEGLAPYMPDAISIRNQIMTEVALKHSRDLDITVILQCIGLLHLFGNRKGKYPFETSLYSLLRNAGASVIAVYPTDYRGNARFDAIPHEAIPELPNTVVIDSLSEEYFERKQKEGTQNWADKDAEAAFIRSVYAASGKVAKFRDRKSPLEAAWWNAVARHHATEILENYKDSDVRVMNSLDLS